MTKKDLLSAVESQVKTITEKNKEVYKEFIANIEQFTKLNKQASELNIKSASFGRKANSTKRKMKMKYYKYLVYLIIFIIALILVVTIAGFSAK